MKRILLILFFALSIGVQYAQVPSTTCAGAPTLIVDGGCISGAPLITMGAAYNTVPVLAPTCGPAPIRVGYYQFTTGASPTTINVSASNGNRNLAIQIFSGSCGAPVAVACANAFGAGASTESCVFSAAASTTYWIEIMNVGASSMDLNSVCVTSSIMGTGAVYIGSNGGNPWGSVSNQDAMNTVFGGGWTQAYFETVNPATTFVAANCFIFIEGGDFTANTFNTFITTNMALMQNWVNMGGRLILNAAPNTGGNINYGFGGVVLNYNGGSSLAWDGNASAGQNGHPIFNGPYLPCGTAFTSNYFAHAFITGGGTTSLMDYLPAPGPSLTEKVWGSGRVMFGGMTTANWHNPHPNGENLIANIISYQANCITPLPVQLVEFTGECSHQGSVIRWTTATEINNSEFIIESSSDGINYKLDGNVSGAGNSNELREYSYTSSLRMAPGNYFRLKQVDYDGTEKIFSPIYIACDGSTNNCVVLNTNNDQIELDIYSIHEEEITCTLLDTRGSVISTIEIKTDKGANTINMNAAGLSSGVYMVMVTGSNHQCTSKFLKY